MGWFRLSSLRVRLIAICSLVVVPAFGVVFYAFQHERMDEIEKLKANAARTAGLVAAEENRRIEETRGFLLILSRIPEMRSPASGECRETLAQIHSRYPRYRNIGIADLQGNIVCSAVPLPQPINVSDRQYFRQAMENRDFGAGAYQEGRVSARPVIVVAYRLTDSGERARGVVFAALDTEEFGNIRKEIGEILPKGAFLTKIDSGGAVLGRYPEDERMIGKTYPDLESVRPLLSKDGGVATGYDGAGTAHIFAVAKMPGTLLLRDVFAIVSIPRDLAFSSIDAHILWDSLILGVGLAISLFAVWISSGYFILRPVRSLLHAMHRVGTGDTEVRMGPPYDKGELGELARGFDMMTAAIKTRRTEREQAREELSRSEENYRSIVRNSPLGIYRVSTDGSLLMVNPALVDMLGYESEEELLKANMDRDIFLNPGERQRILKRYDRRDHGSSVVISLAWKRKDGSALHVLASGTAVRNPDGSVAYYEVFVEDESERRALETQLLHSQKMEAVGRLAGGVAHDFNNLLSVILGYGEILLAQMKDGDERSKLEEIRKAAERAAGLTRQLLAFSRKQVFELKVVDLNDVLANARKMFQRMIGEDIDLSLNLSVDIGRVKIDPGQFEQVVMNLVVNARDAMPRGGKLIIETLRADLTEPQVYLDGMVTMPAGPYVQVNVTDTGCGMDEDTLKRIFDPFFTTKESGKGTGLGLSTSYGIVKQSGGYIWAHSKQGKGTAFRIFLPEVGEAAEDAAARPVPAPLPGGTETILVAEDDDSVRNLIREFLEPCGYRVLAAGSPLEALRIAGAERGAIDLLITDVVMPGESGPVLAERLTRAWPKEKVLYISGYPADSISAHGVLKKGISFLPKPFTREVLARKVREVLDS